MYSFALWPASQTIDKQRASLGKTFSYGVAGENMSSGGTNVVEALKWISTILQQVKGP